jgi:dethiobiotin synthetase
MSKGIFITAVDTEAGKTLCGCALSECLTEMGLDVGVYKPVLSGAPEDNGKRIREDAVMLKKASGSDDDIELINPYCFVPPVTPAHAACMEKVRIDKNVLINNYNTISARHDLTIVEGAGGLMVPVTDDYLIVDLIRDLGLSVIVITDTKLGRINHTLMTMKVLESYGINTLGIIVNRYPKEPEPRDKSLLKYLMIFDNKDILGIVAEIKEDESFYDDFVSNFKFNVDIKAVHKGIYG